MASELSVALVDGSLAQADDLLRRHATAADHRQAECSGRPGRSRQSLLARALLRRTLQAAYGIAGWQWRLTRDAAGGLVAMRPDGTEGPLVSVSHRGPIVVCVATALGAVGIDVEVWRDRGDRVHDMAAAYFSAGEREAVTRGGDAAFLRCWTVREAVAKAEGTGLAGALRPGIGSMTVHGRPVWRVRHGGATWHLGQRAIGTVTLAVALRPGPAASPRPAAISKALATGLAGAIGTLTRPVPNRTGAGDLSSVVEGTSGT